jgi:hypothetical protein
MKILNLKNKGYDIRIGGLKNYWLAIKMFHRIEAATNPFLAILYDDLDIKFSKLITSIGGLKIIIMKETIFYYPDKK